MFFLLGCDTETAISEQEADPVLVEYPVVYIKRDLVTSINNNDEVVRFQARNPAIFNPGAHLFIKRNAFADSPSTNLTESLFGEDTRIDIRDISVSDDGQEILLSIRAPELEDTDENSQPRWNIWHYHQSTQTLKRIITNDVTAEQGDDLMPSFLPDGRIIFASTRQRLSRAILLDEGKPQYTALDERRNNSAFNIHVMNADGTAIDQLTFNMSHDFYPLVLQNGQILYSRWDTMGDDHGINLYRMNPDGTENELVFGWHSHQISLDQQNERVEFIKPQQMPNGDILMLLASVNENSYQKRPVLININDFIDNEQAVTNTGGQSNAITDLSLNFNFDFNFSSALSLSGRINHQYPLPDSSDRFLMSWDVCRVVIGDLIKACGQLSEEEIAAADFEFTDPQYELWLLNNDDNTQQLVATTEEGKVITEALVMQAAEQNKTFIADKAVGVELDAQLTDELSAAIHIRSVYDFDGQDVTVQESNPDGIARLSDPSLTPSANLPARFLRIIRGVPMPPDDVREVERTDFGRSDNQLMREIIGYTPIQPDGSVKVKVPANIPLGLSVLDKNGKRITGRHRQWITLKPGETLECNGCHTQNSTAPHGRIDAQLSSINIGAAGGVAYINATENIIPTQGQTMAQADEMANGLAQLSANIVYQDIWTNPDISTPNLSFASNYENLLTLPPNGSECFNDWNTYCRLQINYQEHIQPLWDLSRQTIDENTLELLSDNTCTGCHSTADTDSVTQVPAGQLDLSGTPSANQPAHYTSYRELFFSDVEQEIVDGVLVDKLIEVLDADGNVVYRVDNEGELILDAENNPIPVLTFIFLPVNLSTNGAYSSNRFFNALNNDTHKDMMSGDEIKLLSEWLDIGAQYYNTPFYLQE
jgi:hypothetical protein